MLAGWQRAIVDVQPRAFLRGLIHGRLPDRQPLHHAAPVRWRQAEYAYARYFFSNLSVDIRNLFCEYCERLGIRWTQSNHRNISISHRRSVAAMDAFIGPKA